MDGRVVGIFQPGEPNDEDADHAEGFSLALRHALQQVTSQELADNAAPRSAEDDGRTWRVRYTIDLVEGSTKVIRYRCIIEVADWPF